MTRAGAVKGPSGAIVLAKRYPGRAVAIAIGALSIGVLLGISQLGPFGPGDRTSAPVTLGASPELDASGRQDLTAFEHEVDRFAQKGGSAPNVFSCSFEPPDQHHLLCARRAAQFVRAWPRAWQGDLRSQRFVASCFTDGCDGALVRDRVQGCAWSLVVLAAGSRDAAIDATGARDHCGSISDEYQLSAAKARALEILSGAN